MEKKPYTSLEHHIRNIMEAVPAKAPEYKHKDPAFLKPIGVIAPPKGEEHPNKRSIAVAGARRAAKASNAEKVEESGAVDSGYGKESVAELSAKGAAQEEESGKSKKKIKESATSDREEMEFVSRRKEGEPTAVRKAIIIIARMKDEMPKSKKSTLGRNAANKQRRIDETVKSIIKDEQKKRKEQGPNPLVDFKPKLSKEQDHHGGDSKIVKEGVGSALSKAGSYALKGAKFVPGLQTAIGLGQAGYRAAQGDWTGAGLAAGSAIPGPVGWAFTGADIARDVMSGSDEDKKKPGTAQAAELPKTTGTTPQVQPSGVQTPPPPAAPSTPAQAPAQPSSGAPTPPASKPLAPQPVASKPAVSISSVQQPPAVKPSVQTPAQPQPQNKPTSGMDAAQERQALTGSGKVTDFESGGNKKRVKESFFLKSFNNYRKINS